MTNEELAEKLREMADTLENYDHGPFIDVLDAHNMLVGTSEDIGNTIEDLYREAELLVRRHDLDTKQEKGRLSDLEEFAYWAWSKLEWDTSVLIGTQAYMAEKSYDPPPSYYPPSWDEVDLYGQGQPKLHKSMLKWLKQYHEDMLDDDEKRSLEE